MAMFKAFPHGNLDIYRLNFAMLTLIPKENDAKTIQKYRPISLANCIFKIFTKAMTNRLVTVADRLISGQQTAFIKVGIFWKVWFQVSTHEIIHSVATSGKNVLVLKLDYEKAYDRVNWDFFV